MKKIIMLTILLVMLSAQTIGNPYTYAAATVIPSDAIKYNGHHYKVYSASVTWDEAKALCEEKGGHLATITTKEEQAFIESINSSEKWIGGFRDNNFVWQWVTGEAWDYTAWEDGEPNNCDDVVPNENALTVYPFKWNDLASTNLTQQFGYICEWDDSSYYTTTNSVLGKTYGQIVNLFTNNTNSNLNCYDYAKSLIQKDIIIPGLERTNQTVVGKKDACHNMIPQGVCVTNKYILISAYDGCENRKIKSEYKHKKHSSVIYVMNKKTHSYIKTIVLNGYGHAGAMAWDKKDTVYIASGSKEVDYVYMIKTSDIDNSKMADAVTVPVSCIKVPQHPSFLAYSGGYLYIGEMGNTSNGSNVILAKCDKSGEQVDFLKCAMPNKTQGVAFVQGIDGKNYLVASLSLGRNADSTSELRCYEINFGSHLIKYQRPINSVSMPKMSEDVDISGGLLYTCFESAANFYRINYDGSGFSALPIDRVLTSNVQTMLGIKTSNKSSKSKGFINEDIEEIDTGECGELATYTMYSNGTLMISGFGGVSDYSISEETPWYAYADEIRNIVIGEDISSIGENTFSNLENLEKVTFSKMMNKGDAFKFNFNIGKKAFYNCKNLKIADMPNANYLIHEDTFGECDNLQIRKNSNLIMFVSGLQFGTPENVKLHDHEFHYSSTAAPTCLDDGYDIYKCDCGEEDLRNVKSATDNHSYMVTDSYGNMNIYTCEKCGSQYEAEIENKLNNGATKKITPKNNKPTSIKKIKAKKKSLKIYWKKVSGVNGYKIQYSRKKNFKDAKTKVIKKLTTTSFTIKKLKRKRKYYVRIRTYRIASGKIYQSGWSKAKSKKTK